jgi:signal transduction histidine kinase
MDATFALSRLDAHLLQASAPAAPPVPAPNILLQCSMDLGLATAAVLDRRTDLLLVLASLRYHGMSGLYARGLELEWAVERVDALPGLEAAAALHVLHIVHEVVLNIARHSRAEWMRVSTATEARWAVVRIDDDGLEFDGPRAHHTQAGRGLADIARRAYALNAQLVWKRREGGGTRFELRLPLPTRMVIPSLAA